MIFLVVTTFSTRFWICLHRYEQVCLCLTRHNFEQWIKVKAVTVEKLVAESSSGDAPSIEQANSLHSQQKLAGEGKFALLQFVTLVPDAGIWSTSNFRQKRLFLNRNEI